MKMRERKELDETWSAGGSRIYSLESATTTFTESYESFQRNVDNKINMIEKELGLFQTDFDIFVMKQKNELFANNRIPHMRTLERQTGIPFSSIELATEIPCEKIHEMIARPLVMNGYGYRQESDEYEIQYEESRRDDDDDEHQEDTSNEKMMNVENEEFIEVPYHELEMSYDEPRMKTQKSQNKRFSLKQNKRFNFLFRRTASF